jgi:hypothetical protein
VGSQWEGGSGGGTSITPITGDKNREEEAMWCGHFQRKRGGRRQGTSTALEMTKGN